MVSVPSRPLLDRIEEKLDLSDPSGCWMWTGARNSHGYGNVCIDHAERRYGQAHRALYELIVEPVPAELELDQSVPDFAVREP